MSWIAFPYGELSKKERRKRKKEEGKKKKKERRRKEKRKTENLTFGLVGQLAIVFLFPRFVTLCFGNLLHRIACSLPLCPFEVKGEEREYEGKKERKKERKKEKRERSRLR